MSEDGTSGPSGGRSYGGLLANATFTSADGGDVRRLNKDSAPSSAGTQSNDGAKKVQLGAGYSQMDWMRLTKKDNDLAGLNGASRKRKITLEEIAQHSTMDDCWTVLRGKVYNLTPYINFHPGGDKILKGILGKDCTKLFDKYHKWVNGEYMLEKCKVGVLDTYVPGSDSEEEEEEDEEFSFR
ncbi:cytochrome b5 domain-containing protein [bacterium]|nr:cytochrome b5 domain-containing protein [bacterium]|tara:strand:- start:21 stop:569 length:549 start_codon:yes stop_codon:yes gene_type:complete